MPFGSTVRVLAPNASPLSLEGTNTYVVAGGWVVDPGPDDAGHLSAVLEAAGGAIAGIVLTHLHADHSAGAKPLAELAGGGVPIVLPEDAQEVGPLTAIATPGHTADHICLLNGGELFTGDTVLGRGSVFIQPGEGSLSAYLASLRALRELPLEVIYPGHGPIVEDPIAKLDEYIEHRLDRERRLLDALEQGARSEDELLDRAWSDAPPHLRMLTAMTLHAHLEKLAEEGRLPEDMVLP